MVELVLLRMSAMYMKLNPLSCPAQRWSPARIAQIIEGFGDQAIVVPLSAASSE